MLALSVALLLLLPSCAPHSGCIHSSKVIRTPPTRGVQDYGSRRLGEGNWQPMRITFDFSRVDNNGQPAAQQDYVKSLLNKAGEWINRALRVRPVLGPLKFSGAGVRCGDEVPASAVQRYVDTGAYNTDLLIFVLSDAGTGSPCSQGGAGEATTLAYASHCQLDQDDRPVFGFIQMCAAAFAPKVRQSDLDEDFHTALHEITHILGFSDRLFGFFRDAAGHARTPRCPAELPRGWSSEMPAEYQYAGERFLWYRKNAAQVGWCCAINTLGQPPFRCEAAGYEPLISSAVVAELAVAPGSPLQVAGRRKVLQTPNLVELGKMHFGCQEGVGVELEDDGGEGTAGSHWERRILLNEYMTGRPTGLANAKSAFTLALLQDSGWYQVDFAAADALEWGHGYGCDFLRSCEQSAERVRAPAGFCKGASTGGQPALSDLQCVHDRSAVAFCHAGDGNLMDGCAAAFRPSYGGYLCSGADGLHAESPSFYRAAMATRVGNASACFRSTLWKQTARGRGSSDPVVGCYGFRCVPRANPMLGPACSGSCNFSLHLVDPTGTERECQSGGEQLPVAGFEGALVCPDEWERLCQPRHGFFAGVTRPSLGDQDAGTSGPSVAAQRPGQGAGGTGHDGCRFPEWQRLMHVNSTRSPAGLPVLGVCVRLLWLAAGVGTLVAALVLCCCRAAYRRLSTPQHGHVGSAGTRMQVAYGGPSVGGGGAHVASGSGVGGGSDGRGARGGDAVAEAEAERVRLAMALSLSSAPAPWPLPLPDGNGVAGGRAMSSMSGLAMHSQPGLAMHSQPAPPQRQPPPPPHVGQAVPMHAPSRAQGEAGARDDSIIHRYPTSPVPTGPPRPPPRVPPANVPPDRDAQREDDLRLGMALSLSLAENSMQAQTAEEDASYLQAVARSLAEQSAQAAGEKSEIVATNDRALAQGLAASLTSEVRPTQQTGQGGSTGPAPCAVVSSAHPLPAIIDLSGVEGASAATGRAPEAVLETGGNGGIVGRREGGMSGTWTATRDDSSWIVK